MIDDACIIIRALLSKTHHTNLCIVDGAWSCFCLQARILDLLLSLPTQEERVALLPDCFTPPSEDSSNNAPSQEAADEETDELWCTPAQLLSEIESRLKAMAVTSQPTQPIDSQLLPPVSGELVGQQLEHALSGLREHVRNAWLASLPGADYSAGIEP
jgi:hypothetical protein